MEIAVLIATLQKAAPVVIEVADALHLNKLAADLVRKLTALLVEEAKKTATPVDDFLVSLLTGLLGHVADLLEQGAVQDAIGLLNAIGKFAKA